MKKTSIIILIVFASLMAIIWVATPSVKVLGDNQIIFYESQGLPNEGLVNILEEEDEERVTSERKVNLYIEIREDELDESANYLGNYILKNNYYYYLRFNTSLTGEEIDYTRQNKIKVRYSYNENDKYIIAEGYTETKYKLTNTPLEVEFTGDTFDATVGRWGSITDSDIRLLYPQFWDIYEEILTGNIDDETFNKIHGFRNIKDENRYVIFVESFVVLRKTNYEKED